MLLTCHEEIGCVGRGCYEQTAPVEIKVNAVNSKTCVLRLCYFFITGPVSITNSTSSIVVQMRRPIDVFDMWCVLVLLGRVTKLFRRRSVFLSICPLVMIEVWKNGRTSRYAVWSNGSGWPKESRIRRVCMHISATWQIWLNDCSRRL